MTPDPLAVSEQDFQAQVLEAARHLGWETMHVRKALGGRGKQGWVTPTSVKGWPDAVLWHPGGYGCLFAEFKSETGVLSDEQERVLDSLRAAGLEVHVWRPSDWSQIEARLGEPRRLRRLAGRVATGGRSQ